MNKTKRNLIIAVIVLNFLSVAANVYVGVVALLTSLDSIYVTTAVYLFIGCLSYLLTNGFLIYSIADGGRHFRARYGFYMTAVMLTMIFDFLSLSSILLVVTMFLSDIVWIRPQDDDYYKPDQPEVVDKPLSDSEKERKIVALRKLRDEGKITEEEFKEELFKLL